MEDVMIDKYFGRLKVVERIDDYVAPNGSKHIQYRCECSCGNSTIAKKEYLTSGRKKSCGCLKKENGKKTHGEIHTRLYRIWSNMCTRCSNPNNPAWAGYGGRGIHVCDDWKQFENFRDWAYNSDYSDELTIDRIDNNQGYNPNNCRWANSFQQANNKRNNHLVEHNGEVKTLSEWAKFFNIPYKTLHRRIVDLGWTTEKAFTQPLRQASQYAKHN
jgi:hypothetical protein